MKSTRNINIAKDVLEPINHKRSMSIPSASFNDSQSYTKSTGEEDLQREIENNLVKIQLVAR